MLKERREAYLNRIEAPSISYFFSGIAPYKTADQKYYFSVNRDFFYLTNLAIENTILVLVKSATRQESYIFTEKVDELKALWEGPGLSFDAIAAKTELPVANIRDLETLETFTAGIMSSNRRAIFGQISYAYLDFDRIDSKANLTESDKHAVYLQKHYPFLSIRNAHAHLAHLRTKKDAFEISQIQKAVDVSQQAYEHLLHVIPTLDEEHQVEAEYNYILNKNQTIPSFNSIVASGKNGTILHYGDNNQPLDKSGLLLLDLGVQYQNYASDITRTYPVSGKFTKRQKEVYQSVLNVNKAVIAWAKAGITQEAFNQFGKELIIKELYNLGLIKKDEEYAKYYYHSLGHYLGLDVHDEGNYAEPFPVGTVITVEPGIYIAEEGIGVRIEDDIVLTENGNICLSHKLVKEVVEIEKAMEK